MVRGPMAYAIGRPPPAVFSAVTFSEGGSFSGEKLFDIPPPARWGLQLDSLERVGRRPNPGIRTWLGLYAIKLVFVPSRSPDFSARPGRSRKPPV